MEPKDYHRKRTSIFSTDVVGNSRLMQDDEAAAVKTFESYKKIISDLVEQPHGRPLRRRIFYPHNMPG